MAVAPPVLLTVITRVKSEPKFKVVGVAEKKLLKTVGLWISEVATAVVVDPVPSNATTVCEKVTVPALAAE